MNQKSLFKNSIYKALLSFANIVVPIIIGPYITKLLDVELYGAYNKVYSEFQVFLIFATFGIYTFGVRGISKVRDNPEKLSELFTNLFLLGIITNTITGIVYVIYSIISSSGITQSIYLIFIIQIIANVFYIEFLNEVTKKTLYVDKIKHNVEMYNGNYEKYLKIKEEKDKARERLIAKQSDEEEKLKRIIAKYLHGTEKQANIAKDRIKKLEKLKQVKVEAEKKQKITKFKIKINYPSTSIPIEVNHLKFGYDENNLLYNDLSFIIQRGEKILIVGENGIGKTTLLRLIMGTLKPIDGEIKINDKTLIGYYAQEHEIIDNSKTILNNFNNYGLADYEVRRYLGNFLFSGEDINKLAGVLSPGERSRVGLAKIALSGANTLLLDEPTNHLDPMTQLKIADIFKDYEGTMLVVSHNLEFVDSLNIDRMLLLPSGVITYYDKEIVTYYETLNNNEEIK